MATSASVAVGVVVESYRLISIERTTAPSDGAGGDWFVYRIAQGKNLATGYRRGNRGEVGAEVERIVNALNVRLLVKGQRYRSAGRPPKPPPRDKELR
jgi:hypothetical protein